MSRRKDNNTLIGGLLIGAGAIFLFNIINRRSQYSQGLDPRFQSTPTPPASNKAEEWQSWIATIIALYGNIKELWEPGGPFYKYRNDPIFDQINPNDVSTTV